MTVDVTIHVQEGTLYLPKNKQVVFAEVIGVDGLEGYALLYVGGGYVPAVWVPEDRKKQADAHFVMGDMHVWFARLCWLLIQHEEFGECRDVVSYADLQQGDQYWEMAPCGFWRACQTVRTYMPFSRRGEVKRGDVGGY